MQEVACGTLHLVVTSMSIGILVSADIRASTDLIRNLGLNLVADRSGVLLGNLVALLLDILLAVRSRGVSMATITRLCISLVVTSMNLVGVMSNNMRALVHLLVCLLTVLCDNVLTFFNVGSVNDNIKLLMTLLSLFLDGLLMALLLHILMTLWSS